MAAARWSSTDRDISSAVRSCANYDMSTWQAQTVVSLLERDHAARMSSTFGPWWTATWNSQQASRRGGFRVMALLRGTTLGARDFGLYSRRIRRWESLRREGWPAGSGSPG